MTRLLLAALLGLSTTAHAQEFDEFEDRGGSKSTEAVVDRSEVVREVVKGFYAKSSVGTALYLAKFMGSVKPGTSVSLAMGQDFVDNEHSSLAWELGLLQGVHNSDMYDCIVTDNCLQGDLRTYTLSGSLEAAFYPDRRFGLGARVVGGLMLAPLLIVNEGATSVPLTEGFHGVPHPVVGGGLELEYYSKLSHFSVGLNADALYTIGFDLGLNATAFLKYTI